MRYVYQGPGPVEADGGIARPGDVREFDAEPDWGPWSPAAESPVEPPATPPPTLTPDRPPAASTAPATATDTPAPDGGM